MQAFPSDSFEDEGELVIIFRLGNELLAIKVDSVSQVLPKSQMHSVPKCGMQNQMFVCAALNFQGRVIPCIDMHQILGVNNSSSKDSLQSSPRTAVSRMIVIQDTRVGERDDPWGFISDEVFGFFRFFSTTPSNLPLSFVHAKQSYLAAIFRWNQQDVGLIDLKLLFDYLHRAFG